MRATIRLGMKKSYKVIISNPIIIVLYVFLSLDFTAHYRTKHYYVNRNNNSK